MRIMRRIFSYTEIEDYINSTCNKFAGLIKTAIMHNRGGIIHVNGIDKGASITWYKWRRYIYIDCEDLSDATGICIILNTRHAYMTLLPDRYTLYRHKRILHYIHAVVQPPDGVTCLEIANQRGGIYTIECLDIAKKPVTYVYTPISWLPVQETNIDDPWLILKHQYHVNIPSTRAKRVWSSRVAAQIAQSIIMR